MVRVCASIVFCAVSLFGLAIGSAAAVTIDTVPVGNPGNAGELSGISAGGVGPDAIVGSVAYEYRIGTYEVTNAQYAEFLNAKAASDPLSLYATLMGSDPRGGITRSGSGTLVDPYAYATKENMGNKPVGHVSWYSAIRFANWLHNGQGSGDTETGAYTLGKLGAFGVPINGLAVTRNAGATWWLPSENEWYKAAYYDPTLNDGSGGYWDYATGSNADPIVATANGVGDISNPGVNVANYLSGADWNGQVGNVTTVGTAGQLSGSYYGTSDQSGNVWEWNETLIAEIYRGLCGGSWAITNNYGPLNLAAAARGFAFPTAGPGNFGDIGFRVATVPEPSSLALAALGLIGLLVGPRWRRAVNKSALAMLAALVITSAASAVTIDTVPVGNPGNAGDPSDGDSVTPGLQSLGSVSYDYRIGVYEVTNAQYVEFLNAKAATDPLGLYNSLMGSDVHGGIARSGSGTIGDPYTYVTKPNMSNKPVNFVSWYDAARFTNWMHNGQVNGGTETGAYTLLGGNPLPSNGDSITRNIGATWFLPTEDEWYKAAYHQPAAQGGDSDNYWLYPTGSNSAPTIATANSVGDISNPGANVANYGRDEIFNNIPDGNVTTVGSAGPLSASFYGTYDQGGNVWEWNETPFSFTSIPYLSRGGRGGSWESVVDDVLQASFRSASYPEYEGRDTGFRVATVPEPGSRALAIVALLATLGIARARSMRRVRNPDTCQSY